MKSLWRIVYSDTVCSSKLSVMGGGYMYDYMEAKPLSASRRGTPMPIELYRHTTDLPKHRIEVPIWP